MLGLACKGFGSHTYNCHTPIDRVGLYMVRGLYRNGNVFRVYGKKNMKGIFMN